MIVRYSMANYDFEKGKKRQKLNKLKPQTISETMPSQNRLALEHMLEFEEEPSEEFKSSVAALPVDLVSNPNQFLIYKYRSCNNCDFYNKSKTDTKRGK